MQIMASHQSCLLLDSFVTLQLQLSVVEHAIELTKLALPQMNTSNVEIYQGTEASVSTCH